MPSVFSEKLAARQPAADTPFPAPPGDQEPARARTPRRGSRVHTPAGPRRGSRVHTRAGPRRAKHPFTTVPQRTLLGDLGPFFRFEFFKPVLHLRFQHRLGWGERRRGKEAGGKKDRTALGCSDTVQGVCSTAWPGRETVLFLPG